ncbi:MAG: tRNA preQ1(34) S-adenosylmethionine ribosyltransferase-isomerase QueA [Desulfovibrio sp.]|nr:tRNA preQ1(34) S-adenosylmethionine ribosyltransferase-isomerase QueA [Desulfovibrio sp.]
MHESPCTPDDFFLRSYNFDLPQEQIAQFPAKARGDSRLLVMNKGPKDDIPPHLIHTSFNEVGAYLPDGALLLGNNSRVLPARLLGHRETGGKMEFLLLTPLPLLLAGARREQDMFTAPAEGLFRSGFRVRSGDTFFFDPALSVTILENGPFGRKKVRLTWRGNLESIFTRIGHIPLPPYINRSDENLDKERYQTVYADNEKTGSVAAPTAGLHFTQEILSSLKARGILWESVTLYVGYGTFSPVRVDDIRKHTMHKEYVEISEQTCRALEMAKKEKRPIIAVGTTSLRALEGMMRAKGAIVPFGGWTDIFLYPGQPIRLVDGLITNFHLPFSSLLMLVSALAGRKRILAAYQEAVRKGYRFFSYGDAMFIRP